LNEVVHERGGAARRRNQCALELFCLDQKVIRTSRVDEEFNDTGEQLATYINQLIEEADDGRSEEQGASGPQQDQHA
jgi:hypothetical protein